MTILSIGTGVYAGAIVGIDDVAGGAAAGAIIAGMVVGAKEIEGRIEQARALQAHENGIGAVFGAEAASAQASAWPSRFFQTFGVADLNVEAAATFEEAQDVAGLGH